MNEVLPHVFLPYAFGFAAASGAVGLLCARDAARGALCLALTMAALSGVYAVDGATLAAAVQLFVYAGSCLVLLLSALLLEGHARSEAAPKYRRGFLGLPVALLCGFGLALVFWEAPPIGGGPTETVGSTVLAWAACSCLAATVFIGVVLLAEPSETEN